MSAPCHKPETAFAASVRLAGPDDLDALVALENASFVDERASRRSIRYSLRSPTMSVLAAVLDDSEGEVLVGAATIERRRKSRIARLASIAVSSSRSGQGLGSLLLDAVEAEALAQDCSLLRLEARTDNLGAIRLYERRGYKHYGTKPDYYQDGTAALCFEKILIVP
ncbi:MULTISPECIES: GNAT family N-acetyltransferase [Methylobacterium]|uniref:dTDP-fucosamine acetyltransferase n=1 Tax=Methylobacterium thuringiense TaxID=1003091 RepID=A0ABQ4TFV3_9HYPH|nr:MULTISPECIES: N-acetyltransferase [Methylobacterium]TXN23521.1 GNAT family N-acetyltransferase [Methylobacterium sp. WL9]GJE53649.1 dTDP-fucosamine acetyltransferase [Methylobacterium thuringiense]